MKNVGAPYNKSYIDWLFSSKYFSKFKCCIQFIDSWGGLCGLCIRWMCLLLQGLLKVAIDNARTQEKQVQLEKTELKMELFRERELRETLEKQLAVEQKNRGVYYSKTYTLQYTQFIVSSIVRFLSLEAFYENRLRILSYTNFRNLLLH